MRLTLHRIAASDEATVGVLHCEDVPVCWSLEDQAQPAGKVAGETRIPAGVYDVAVRTHGGFHDRYARRFGDAHRGMLEIRDIPGFTDVLIHIGNTDDDTAGCVLTGLQATLERPYRLYRSTDAYRRLYGRVIDAALAGDLHIAIREPPRFPAREAPQRVR